MWNRQWWLCTWAPHLPPSFSGAPLTSCFIYCGSRLKFISKGVSLQSGNLNSRKQRPPEDQGCMVSRGNRPPWELMMGQTPLVSFLKGPHL